ncbi:MAG: hypothetical protein IID38_08515 [Planctomycetes bacterium]|nr:hypothetical protein [Planctomycetota bacterium]
MRTSEIENQLRQRPFLPFRLRMTDGTAFEVRHPEMLMVSRTIIAVAIHRPRARDPEGIVLCDPVHVIRIEPLSDGRPKARRSSKG